MGGYRMTHRQYFVKAKSILTLVVGCSCHILGVDRLRWLFKLSTPKVSALCCRPYFSFWTNTQTCNSHKIRVRTISLMSHKAHYMSTRTVSQLVRSSRNCIRSLHRRWRLWFSVTHCFGFIRWVVASMCSGSGCCLCCLGWMCSFCTRSCIGTLLSRWIK